MIIIPSDFNLIPELGRGRVIGLTSGCFDLLHFYHLHYLERCKAKCDFLIVGVDADELLTEFKAKAACVPEHHRTSMVAALKCVDAVFTMRNLKQFNDAAAHAHKIFKNHPTLYGQPIVGGEGKLVVIPDIFETTSTTALVEKIRAAASP